MNLNDETYKDEVVKNYMEAHKIFKTIEQTQNEINDLNKIEKV